MSAPQPPDPDRQPPPQPPDADADSGSGGKGSGKGERSRRGQRGGGSGDEDGSGSSSSTGSSGSSGTGRGGSDSDPATGAAAERAAAQAEVAPPTPFTQQLGRVAIVVIAALFGVFAVANSQRVDFSWVFGETMVRVAGDGDGAVGGVPLIVLLLTAFVIGAVVAILTERYVSRSRRIRKAAKQRREGGSKGN